MKKSRVIIIVVIAIVIACAGFFAGMMAKESVAGRDKDIGLETAKEIALSSVGVSADKAVFTKSESDMDTYDIEFYTESNEYDFEINKETGAITDREVSPRVLAVPGETSATEPVGSAEPSQNEYPAPAQPSAEDKNDDDVIGVSAAKQVALDHAGLANASFIDASLDYDDGMRVYDIEFTAGNKEYEYEINAYNGDILDYDIDRLDYDD